MFLFPNIKVNKIIFNVSIYNKDLIFKKIYRLNKNDKSNLIEVYTLLYLIYLRNSTHF